MSILKIKDGNGNFVAVPTLQGPRGATGATGPKGDSYTLTAADKQEIKELVLQDLPVSYPTTITITNPPTTTQYEIGQSLDTTGMVVTLVLNTGETRVLSSDEYTITPAVFTTTGTQNVTITYSKHEPYVLTATQEVTVVDIVPDTWAKMVQVSKTGRANQYFNVGDTINDTYTISGTAHTNTWLVMDFRTVELEDGTTYENVPIIAMEHTNHENVMFDAIEATEATEANAVAGKYYVGLSGSTYTMLSLNTGDAIPYSSYDKVFVTIWNSDKAVRYGTSSWKHSYIRQYMNSSGTGWWQATHDGDIIPSSYENRQGFKSYISEDMANVLHPIKITTQEPVYMGGNVDTTYDTFWLPSLSEMNIQNVNDIATVDGEPWEYYKELLNSEAKVNNGTYEVLKKYGVNATTSVQHYWTRSAVLNYQSGWFVNTDGMVNLSSPSSQFRFIAACAVI